MIEWGKMLETLIAAGAGAAVVVVIDWLVKYYLYKKRNFQEAISIQLALHQMLVVSLQIRKFYDDKKEYFLKFYSQEKFNDTEQVWLKFRHVDFSPFMNTFDVIRLNWDFTQFLADKENDTRKVLKYLIPAKLGYQSLMSIIKERNELLWYVQQKIELARNANGVPSNFEYVNGNLRKVIGLPIDEKLRGMTDKYIETVDYMIVDCNKAFNILSEYVNKNFCHYVPLTLSISDDMKKLLGDATEAESKKAKK